MERVSLQPHHPAPLSIRRGALLIAAVATIGTTAGVVEGQTMKTWDGGGANTSWTTANNWDANTAPVAGNGLVFAGSTRPTNVNNFAANTSFDSLSFLNGGFSISGNAVRLSSSGTDIASTGNNTIALALTGSNNGPLAIRSQSGTLTLSGSIFGSGAISTSGTGTVVFAGHDTNQSLTGDITVNEGILRTGGSHALYSTGALGSGTTANRQITIAPGATLTFGRHDTFGSWNATPAVTLVVNGTVNTDGAWVTALGRVNLNGGTLAATDGYDNVFRTSYVLSNGFDVTVGGSTASTISVGGPNNPRVALRNAVTFNVGDVTGDAADLTVAAILSNHPDGNTVGGLTKTGAGTMRLTASNLYTGTTTVNGGVLQIGGGGTTGSLGSTAAIAVAAGALLEFNRSDDYGGTFSRAISGSGGLLLSSGSLTLSNAASSFTGGVTINGGVLKSGSGTIESANGIVVNAGGRLGMAVNHTWGVSTTATTASVTVNAGGTLTSDGFYNTLRNLTLAGGTVAANGGLSGAGAFGLGGTVTVTSTTPAAITATSGSGNFIRLGREGVVGETTTFNVTDAAGGLLVDLALTDNFATATAGLAKSGPGTLVLAGANSYSAGTTVNAGRLEVQGLLGSGSVSVASGATLAGSGTIGGAVAVNGTLSPGSSPGVLTLSSLTLGSTATTLLEIAGLTLGSGYDGVSITTPGGLAYDGQLSLAFDLVEPIPDQTTLDLFAFSGAPTGDFASVISTGSYAGTWSRVASGTWALVSGGKTLTFSTATGDIVVVPEPGTLALVAAGIVCAAAARAGRRKTAARHQT